MTTFTASTGVYSGLRPRDNIFCSEFLHMALVSNEYHAYKNQE